MFFSWKPHTYGNSGIRNRDACMTGEAGALAIALRPLLCFSIYRHDVFVYSVRSMDLSIMTGDVYIRQILTSKVGRRAERVKIWTSLDHLAFSTDCQISITQARNHNYAIVRSQLCNQLRGSRFSSENVNNHHIRGPAKETASQRHCPHIDLCISLCFCDICRLILWQCELFTRVYLIYINCDNINYWPVYVSLL